MRPVSNGRWRLALGFVADGGFRPIKKPYKYSKRIIPGRIHTLWTSLARSVSRSLCVCVLCFSIVFAWGRKRRTRALCCTQAAYGITSRAWRLSGIGRRVACWVGGELRGSLAKGCRKWLSLERGRHSNSATKVRTRIGDQFVGLFFPQSLSALICRYSSRCGCVAKFLCMWWKRSWEWSDSFGRLWEGDEIGVQRSWGFQLCWGWVVS
jgi:hypothetical protein